MRASHRFWMPWNVNLSVKNGHFLSIRFSISNIYWHFLEFVFRARGRSKSSSHHAEYLCLNVRAGPLWVSWNQIYSLKIPSFQIIKIWQQAVFFFSHAHTHKKKKKTWNMACEKCARWPSCRRCRGGINLITASNIHLANISRLETQAPEMARQPGRHSQQWMANDSNPWKETRHSQNL